MTNIIAKGHELYAALAAGDAGVLQQLLSAGFQGRLSDGLPHGFGRHYDGRDAMMVEGWGAIGDWFEMSPHAQELYDGGAELIARGNYVGIAKASGKPISAAFAHFWSFDGEHFTGVTQVTDTGKWRDALEAD